VLGEGRSDDQYMEGTGAAHRGRDTAVQLQNRNYRDCGTNDHRKDGMYSGNDWNATIPALHALQSWLHYLVESSSNAMLQDQMMHMGRRDYRTWRGKVCRKNSLFKHCCGCKKYFHRLCSKIVDVCNCAVCQLLNCPNVFK